MGPTLNQHWCNVLCLLGLCVFVFIPIVAGPDGSFVSTGACILIRIPVVPDICHRGCAYTVFQTVQWHGVYSAVYI